MPDHEQRPMAAVQVLSATVPMCPPNQSSEVYNWPD
jgi:hypothetical protein